MDPMPVAEFADQLAEIAPGDTYRDSRTGWVGTALVPDDPNNVPRSPKDGRPKIGLRGPSGKEDRGDEIRFGYLDDLEPVDGDPTGFAHLQEATNG